MSVSTEAEEVQAFIRAWCEESQVPSAEMDVILKSSAERLAQLDVLVVSCILRDQMRRRPEDVRAALAFLGVVPAKNSLRIDPLRLRPVTEDDSLFKRAQDALWYAVIDCGQSLPESKEPEETSFVESLKRLPIGFINLITDAPYASTSVNALFDAGASPYATPVPEDHGFGPPDRVPPAWYPARRERKERETAERHARWKAEREREAAEYEQRRNEEELRQRPKYAGTSNLPPAFVAYAGATFAYEHLEVVQDRLIADLAKIRAAGDAADNMSRREGLLDLTITFATTEDHRHTIAERIQKTLRARSHEITERASELRGSALLPMLRLTVNITLRDDIERSQIGLTSMDDFEIHYVKGAEMNDILAKLEGLPSGVS
jgi:hypothetical protein